MLSLTSLRRRQLVGITVLVLSAACSVPAGAFDFNPWSRGGWPGLSPWGRWPGSAPWAGYPMNYSVWNRYPRYGRSGGNPAMGYWRVTPRTFAYRRPPYAGGPYGYVQGWLNPRGDFEGTMVVRGNMRKLFGSYYNRPYYR